MLYPSRRICLDLCHVGVNVISVYRCLERLELVGHDFRNSVYLISHHTWTPFSCELSMTCRSHSDLWQPRVPGAVTTAVISDGVQRQVRSLPAGLPNSSRASAILERLSTCTIEPESESPGQNPPTSRSPTPNQK